MTYHTDLISGITDQLAEAGESLSIARSGQSVTVTGFHGNPNRHVGRGEALIYSDETSFVILRADYAPTGTVSDPRIGDRITRESGEVYEVQRPSDGTDFCDDYGGLGHAWRVRVLRVRA